MSYGLPYERSRQSKFRPGNLAPANIASEEKSAQIDAEISRFIDEAHQRVRSIIHLLLVIALVVMVLQIFQSRKRL